MLPNWLQRWRILQNAAKKRLNDQWNHYVNAETHFYFTAFEQRHLASKRLAQEFPRQTVQPTALVHEAFVRLVSSDQQWDNGGHFFAAGAESMRRLLIDRARDSCSHAERFGEQET